MSGSKLVIFRVGSKSAFEELISAYNYESDLLILAQFQGSSELGQENERVSILTFTDDFKIGTISKLAFSFALDRGYELIAGVFDWGSITIQELSKQFQKFVHVGASLFCPKEVNLPAIRKVLYLLSGVPEDFLENYRCQGIFSGSMLKRLPIEQNLSSIYFDTELMFQMIAGEYLIKVEKDVKFSPAPCRETPTVIQYLKLALTLKLQRLGIFYDPRFDLIQENNQYEAKFDFASSHSMSLEKISSEDTLLILGSGPKELVIPFHRVSKSVVAVDSFIGEELRQYCDHALQADLENVENYDNIAPNAKYSKVVALDIIEHLRSPEEFLRRIRESNSTAGCRIIITTPNIAFLPIRGMLLFGFFNYGKRGILDRTHTRLFTFSSLKRILKQSGFQVEELVGVPAPIPLALGRGPFANFLLKVNQLAIRVWPSLFSFQILAVAKAQPTVHQLLLETQTARIRAIQ